MVHTPTLSDRDSESVSSQSQCDTRALPCYAVLLWSAFSKKQAGRDRKPWPHCPPFLGFIRVCVPCLATLWALSSPPFVGLVQPLSPAFFALSGPCPSLCVLPIRVVRSPYNHRLVWASSRLYPSMSVLLGRTVALSRPCPERVSCLSVLSALLSPPCPGLVSCLVTPFCLSPPPPYPVGFLCGYECNRDAVSKFDIIPFPQHRFLYTCCSQVAAGYRKIIRDVSTNVGIQGSDAKESC